ncbi:MAG TPA: DtxR family transcriptional regulator [Syntrophales bacterium]|jgi:DtxR family Mn-dependent transcriptional regulator|nr:DtxR family transcriptional regulator [Syntrophales bacterium]
MTAATTLTASLEDYLETIYHIIAEKQVARSKDIARQLKVGYASVTGALRALSDKGLINYSPYDVVTLTQKGKTAAEDIVRRHEALRDFFVNVLAVDEKDADDAACKMEHSIPDIILERFIQFAQFVEVCPRGGSKWIAGFGYQCDHDSMQENCEQCILAVLDDVRIQKQQRGRKDMISKKLKDLKPGVKGKVLKITSRGQANTRIVEMGVTPGTVVEVERVAPLGDPIDIKVKGYHLSLRKEEAEGIEVELL